VATRIQLRRGTAAFWTDENPVLHHGEPGFETDTGKLKIGDGETFWRELSYFTGLSLDGDEDDATAMALITAHLSDTTPHSVYDDGPSLALLYENAKV
jgi:hypothetical protein